MTFGSQTWASLYERLELRPVIGGSLPDLLERAADRYRDLVALTDESGRTLTYAALFETVTRFAAGLQGRGVAPGDRVAVMLPNSIEYVVAFFGALKAGAVVVQVNPIYVGRELRHILATTEAATIAAPAAAVDRVREVRADTSLERAIIAGDCPRQDGEEAFVQLVDSDTAPHPVGIDPDRDLASIQFTGGTTGRSKGAMLTHTNLLCGLQPTFDMFLREPSDLPAGSKVVAAAPFFHIFGLTMVLLAGVQHGWNLLLVARPMPDQLIRMIRDEQPAYLAGVATLFMALENHPEAATAGLEKVALYISGGASVPAALMEGFERRTGRTLYEGYGLSEGAPVAFNNYLRGSIPGSIGIPIPSTEVRILDPDSGAELEPGNPGELCVRGPQVMQGYWGIPEETEAALRDGWLHTGDVATVDPDGNLWIVDRIKDMINASGYKVYPREVEEVVYALDDVVEAAVVGVADEYRGETVKLVVVARKGSDLDENRIVEHCRQQLAAYKVPTIIEFRDELPKSAVGKILRRELA